MSPNNQPSLSKPGRVLLSRDAISLSGSAIDLYLLVSTGLGFLVIRLLTDQEIVIALGTVVIGVIGMWVCAIISRLYLAVRALKCLLLDETGQVRREAIGSLSDARS